MKKLIKTIAWAIRHPRFALHWARYRQPFPYVAIAALVALLALPAVAQTNSPPTGIADLGNTVMGYFTAFNTSLDSTFGASTFDLWTGVASVQNGDSPIENELGLSYDVWRSSATNTVATRISLEDAIRDSGLAGSLISDQAGLGFSIVVHDVKLTAYLDGGYNFFRTASKFEDRLFGEVGIRAKKALGSHFYSGIGLGAQFPRNSRVFEAFVGATF